MTTDIHLKRIQDEDDFQAADPDSLMRSISRARLGRALGVSTALHVAVIMLLSVGNIALCVKYRTPNLPRAIALREKARTEKEEQRKAAAAEQRRQEIMKQQKAAAQAAAAKEPESPAQDAEKAAAEGDRPVPRVIRDVTETSDERPTSSGLESIDDFLEE